MQPKKLQHRIFIFILIPVFFLLACIGWISFIYSRNVILEQWGETAIANLQKAAHLIDMRLSRPKELLLMLKSNSNDDRNPYVYSFVIDQLKKMEGVVQVNLDHPGQLESLNVSRGPMYGMGKTSMQFYRMNRLHVSSPQYNTKLNSETVSVSADFMDKNEKKIGRIEVVIAFNDLIDKISKMDWWKGNKAILIDNEGNFLSHTLISKENASLQKNRKFADTDSLEIMTLEALKKNSHGTIFGAGHPPEKISGYYHLNEAPWSLVIIAPGERVLKSIIDFRFYYFIVGFLSITGIILFIRTIISKTTDSIKKVSDAARDLANGIFGEQLPVISKDEVGQLTHNFNKMTKQLQERIKLKKDMNLAMEVQQHLLPPAHFLYKNIEIGGASVYCDETGGDFFDIIKLPEEQGKVFVAVGDVVGHGIGAALLMTTTRALLRSRVTQKGSLPGMINDVNKLLCLDTCKTGSFVTLFFMMIDVDKKQIHWVRAGHEPALIYDPENGKITELMGKGLVLGLDEDFDYSENIHHHNPKGTIVLIGTDGVWDVQNKAGKRFGKEKIKQILKKNSHLPSDNIIQSIISDAAEFRGDASQNDDITLVAIKF